MGELIYLATRQEPWVSKVILAKQLGRSKRYIEARTSEGMPSRLLDGRRQYKVSQVERWLHEHGRLEEGA